MKHTVEKWEATKTESEYFDELEATKAINDHVSKFNGSYEANKGDFEGAILARDEFNANPF